MGMKGQHQVLSCGRKCNFSIYDGKGKTSEPEIVSAYATSRKVADSIPDEVIGFFN
jgi:hypothetical protein